MSPANFEISADLLALLRQPLSLEEEQDSIQAFFGQPQMQAFLQQIQPHEPTAPMLHACAALLPELPPPNAALLALMCGSLVEREEDGADPSIVFPACLQLMERWLQELQPFCAADTSDDPEPDPQDIQHWKQAQARLNALTAAQHAELEALQQAVEWLVLPMMTMVLRDESNHAAFLERTSLQNLLEPMYCSDSLSLEQLYYLIQAAAISYEDELVVVLPTSRTGFVARVHAANNGFHAFSLLQSLMHSHATALNIRPEVWGDAPHRSDEADSDSALFQWLQATAYENGELANPMAWAFGEAPLRSFAKRHGKRVLIALDADSGPRRGWSGFTSPCHDAQNPHVVFKRTLSAEEVAAFLDV